MRKNIIWVVRFFHDNYARYCPETRNNSPPNGRHDDRRRTKRWRNVLAGVSETHKLTVSGDNVSRIKLLFDPEN